MAWNLDGFLLVSCAVAWYNIASKMRHGADSGAGKNRQTQMRKVADIHAHVFPEKLADKAPASISAFYGGMEVACHPATPQKMAFYEQEAGITRFVMSNSATTAHQVHSINDFLPQAVKNILPALCNEFISLLKETSISGYIGLMDLTKGGDIIRSVTYEAFMPLIAVALIYLIMVMGLSKVVNLLERKLRSNER